MDDKWLTVEEIAVYLNVSNDTIYNWIKNRSMPAHKVGRKWMFKQADVDAWVKSGTAAITKETGVTK
ncbi:MAG: helix-turn-helix domain-containing protein [Anaerolineaceae bacterium]|nr:helix-turn-helix domain-containing protein [Anaerolineaceae bacterium]